MYPFIPGKLDWGKKIGLCYSTDQKKLHRAVKATSSVFRGIPVYPTDDLWVQHSSESYAVMDR